MFQIRGPGSTPAPYLLPFRFYNGLRHTSVLVGIMYWIGFGFPVTSRSILCVDADERRMSELSKRKSQLSTELDKYKNYSRNLASLRRELTCTCKIDCVRG